MTTTGQMYLLMVDYGRSREAVCNPEHTRRQIVSEVRDILASKDRTVAFIKFIDGNFCGDVTSEIIKEAHFENVQDAVDDAIGASLAARFDHAYDLRKHSQAAE